MTDILATVDFILDSFERLGRRPLEPGQLDALRIPGTSSALVAVSQNRELFLLLAIHPGTIVEERKLRVLQVTSGDDYSVHDAEHGADVEQRFAVVRLREGHEDLATAFALVSATLLSTLDETPENSDVADFLDNLVRLLAPPRRAAPATITGLWGELWVICTAPTPSEFAAAWHAAPSDRFDFSFPGNRVEVKTTTTDSRVHEFALDQLERRDPKPTWIGSLQVVRDQSGQTIIDLLGLLVATLPRAEAERINRIALETLAGDIESAQDFRFAPFGPEPLRVFLAADIPRVAVPVGSGISGVRFRADLSLVTPKGSSLHELGRVATEGTPRPD